MGVGVGVLGGGGGGVGVDRQLDENVYPYPSVKQRSEVWQNTWESDSRRPRHPAALDNEELFVIEG